MYDHGIDHIHGLRSISENHRLLEAMNTIMAPLFQMNNHHPMAEPGGVCKHSPSHTPSRHGTVHQPSSNDSTEHAKSSTPIPEPLIRAS